MGSRSAAIERLAGAKRPHLIFSSGYRRSEAVGFTHLEAGEPAHRDILAQLGDGLGHHFPYRGAFVLDEVLLVQAILFVELLHLAADDFLNYRIGLPGGPRLLAVNVPLTVQ